MKLLMKNIGVGARLKKGKLLVSIAILGVIVLIASGFFLNQTARTGPSSSRYSENPYTQPIPVKGDLNGVGGFNYTYNPTDTVQSAIQQSTYSSGTCTGLFPWSCGWQTRTTAQLTWSITASSWNLPWWTYTSTSTTSTGTTLLHTNATIAVILVQFSDVPANRTALSIAQEWNGASNSFLISEHWKKEGVAGYYQAVSHNQYTPYADIYGWYTLPNTEAYYGKDCAYLQIDCGIGHESYDTSWRIATAAAQLAINAGANLSQYQNLVIVHSGKGQESESAVTNDVWSVTYYEAPPAGPFSMYSIVPETERSGTQEGQLSDPMGVWCAEFGHQQGWPDMFSQNESTFAKTGRWELESALGTWNGNGNTIAYGGSPAFTAGLNQLNRGWLSVGHGFQQVYPASGNGTTIINLYPIELTTNNGTETQLIEVLGSGQDGCFWIELRTQAGFDTYLPGQGVIIGRITNEAMGTDASAYYIISQQDPTRSLPSTDPYLHNAAWQVGQTYHPGGLNVWVSFLGVNADGSWQLKMVDF